MRLILEILRYYNSIESLLLQTLFSVRSDISSGGEEEHCQMGAVCQLRVTVSALQPSEPHPTSLAYEVKADTDIWMLTGRTTGRASHIVNSWLYIYIWDNPGVGGTETSVP